ncbi:MAG: WecB/TagA/CpsF family glycosyltransferase [Candidatus Omnitrophica bacterium]|nr:WecB/TagA/CpsF family glycosyltransferase [Candidatus Omnitrophota bacterium]
MTRVLGIEIVSDSLEGVVGKIVCNCRKNGKENKIISATDATEIVLANKDPKFHEVLSSFEMRLPDGMASIWVARLKGDIKAQRCSGADFFEMVLRNSSTESINHFFVGGKPELLEKLRAICENKFKNTNIVGMFSPPFGDISNESIVDMASVINNSFADIVWVFLGTPKQCYFASKLSKYTKVKYIITVGAAIDFITKNVTRAPRIIQLLGLEWVFRVMMEPQRLLRRYLNTVLLFFFFSLRELLQVLKIKFLKSVINQK